MVFAIGKIGWLVYQRAPKPPISSPKTVMKRMLRRGFSPIAVIALAISITLEVPLASSLAPL